MRRDEWNLREWYGLETAGCFGIALSVLAVTELTLAQETPRPATIDAISAATSQLQNLDTASLEQLEAALARRRGTVTAEFNRIRDVGQSEAARVSELGNTELNRARGLESQFTDSLDEDLRRDQNAQVLDTARQLEPDQDKIGLFRRAVRVFSRNGDTEDARTAAKEIAPAQFDPAAQQRALSHIDIARQELARGDEKLAWWSLHEAQEIALKLPDRDQALTVFRQIGDVERKLAGGKTTIEGLENEALVSATIRQGVPNPGFEEVEILRVGGGPLRDPQVIRHVYFPTGARKFQGPMLRGGPTIVHTTHARTHCPCDIQIVLPRGAPIIEYSNDEIDYLYPDVEISLHFHRSGKCTFRASQFDTGLQKWMHHLTPNMNESGFWFFGGETNSLKNAASLVSGPVLNVGSRLPITSGLIRPEEKRIRNTLKQPNRFGFEQFFKRESVR